MTRETLPIRFVMKRNGAGDLFRSVRKEIFVIVQQALDIMAEKVGMDIEASVSLVILRKCSDKLADILQTKANNYLTTHGTASMAMGARLDISPCDIVE